MSGRKAASEVAALQEEMDRLQRTNRRLAEMLRDQRISENRLIAQMHRMQRAQDAPYLLSEEYQSMKEQEQRHVLRIRELEAELACTREVLQDTRNRFQRLQLSYERLCTRVSGRKEDLARREEILNIIRREPGEPSRNRRWESLGISRATYYRYRRRLRLEQDGCENKNG